MEEKWELCFVSKADGYIFCSPGAPPKTMFVNAYIKSKGGNPKILTPYWGIYPYLLADGWEPFGCIEDNHIAFRRKVSS